MKNNSRNSRSALLSFHRLAFFFMFCCLFNLGEIKKKTMRHFLLGPVYSMPEELEMEGLTLLTHRIFFVHTTAEEC